MKSSKKLHKQEVRSRQKNLKKQQEKDKKLVQRIEQVNRKERAEATKTQVTTEAIAEEKQEPLRPQEFEESTTFIPNALGEMLLNSPYLYGLFGSGQKSNEPEAEATKREKIMEICGRANAKPKVKTDETDIIDAEFTEIEK
ncbi:MAG: hypothetical protein AB7S44_02785 [Spirochaetales bacterium]